MSFASMFSFYQLIKKMLLEIKRQKENPTLKRLAGKGRIFCVFPRLLHLQLKGLDLYSPENLRGDKTLRYKRKTEILRGQEELGVVLKFTSETKKPTRRPVCGESKKHWSSQCSSSQAASRGRKFESF